MTVILRYYNECVTSERYVKLVEARAILSATKM